VTPPRHRDRSLLAKLSSYLDGDIRALDRRAIETHMRNCTTCRRFVEDLRRTIAACQAEGRQRLPRSVQARARQRIKRLLDEGECRRTSA
jgi:anti-sigma factor RsiW